jgi:hypothetical protein
MSIHDRCVSAVSLNELGGIGLDLMRPWRPAARRVGAAKRSGLFGLGALLPSSGDPAARGRSAKALANYGTKFAAKPLSLRHCGRVSEET